MYPEGFLNRLQTQDYIDAGKLTRSLNDPSPVTIRINRDKWASDPAGSDPVAWCRDAFYLKSRPSFTLDPLFHAGCYYPQEASSMFLEEVFKQTTENRENIRVLDLCGAPGGKATHLSSMIGENGLLVANEVIRQRASVLAENITKWGQTNTLVTQNDPSAFSGLTGFFDIVLVDAPCSGEGMFRDHVAVKEWSVENAFHCSERQKRILMNVWPAIKEEGMLIYSTCTFNPDENEKNIHWLLKNKNAETVKIDISEYKGIREIDYEGIFGYGFYPDKIRGEGFFISVLRKKERTNTVTPGLKIHKQPFVNDLEMKSVMEWTDFNYDTLVKFNNDIISIPGSYYEYMFLSEKLRIIRHGTKILSVKGRNHIPSHELALSVRLKINLFYTLNIGLEQALKFLRRGNITAVDVPEEWILIRYNGINLGYAKNVGNRINNYYPIEWRIKMRTYDHEAEKLIKWIDNNMD